VRVQIPPSAPYLFPFKNIGYGSAGHWRTPPETDCQGLGSEEAIWPLLAIALIMLTTVSPGWAQSAPDFTLKDVVNGKEYTLSKFRGKVVLVNFFTFLCGPCREEMPQLSQLDQELKSQGFQTLGIGLASSTDQLRSLTEKLGLKYPVLAGTDQVSKAYGKVEFVPMTFIIDRQGNIAHKILGARSKEDFRKMVQSLL
jgi:peroxiredoxin